MPHTADVIFEAWGPDLATCCEEAVAALLGAFIDASRARIVDRRAIEIPPAGPDAMLLGLLDEVLFVLDTTDAVPVAAHVEPSAAGGLRVQIDGADLRSIEPTGAVPKAISRSGLRVDVERSQVRCTFLVDV